MEHFFVTGTDTGVGKSVVSALLTIALKASYWKPIQSGVTPYTDTEWVRQVTGLSEQHFIPEIYRLTNPLSPHAAAEIDRVTIDLNKIVLPLHSPLVIEGAGGILVPLNSREMMIDLIEKLQVPVILVARTALGTINHTLLTLSQLRSRGIPIFGVVLNGPKNESNRNAIIHYGKINVIAELEPMPKIDPQALENVARCFDKWLNGS